MRQLRHGVQLKKVEHVGGHSVEYELTPYEILMEDIRSRRYTLNKVMVRFLSRNTFTFEEQNMETCNSTRDLKMSKERFFWNNEMQKKKDVVVKKKYCEKEPHIIGNSLS